MPNSGTPRARRSHGCNDNRPEQSCMNATLASLPVSGVVIAMNEGDRIERCIASMRGLCAEVIVLDSGSEDDTVARARAAGAIVDYQAWLGFSRQRNAAIARASQPWVLQLDADEWLAAGADRQVRRLFANRRVEQADIWRLKRGTRFLGRPLRFGGWAHEPVERLFRSGLRYPPASVHEKLASGGCRIGSIYAHIEHETARTESEYRHKLAGYARLWAEQKRSEGMRAGLGTAFVHALAYWMKGYLLRGGFLDGRTGWRYHRCHAGYVLAKYLILAGYVS